MTFSTPAKLCTLLLVGCALGGCKKKPAPPKSLSAVSTDKACHAFFSRVRACSADIDRVRADELHLAGNKRVQFLARLARNKHRALENLDKLCDRIGWKVEQQLEEMDRCYRKSRCVDFAQCFVKMADSEVGGPMQVITPPSQELRDKLRRLRAKRHHHEHPMASRPGPGTLRPRPAPTRRPGMSMHAR